MADLNKYPRSSGVLLPITMLHGPFGIGVLGKEAMEFVDFLSEAGFRSWQVLPVECTGDCFSPYNCISSFAGEPMLIDPRMLLDLGLVSNEELDERAADLSNDSVEYPVIREKQLHLLSLAFSRLVNSPHFRFARPWLDDYALYMALRRHFDDLPWFNWTDEKLRNYDRATIKKMRIEMRKEIDFYKFVQWLFDRQWQKLKAYSSERGVSIIGDMPIYVAKDSVEVWSRREFFETDSAGNFTAVSGCPPDYYNPDGQLWGNPLYNWKLMKSDGYMWWIDRLKSAMERYEIIRLDHFRGFESFWQIPADSQTAKNGKWVKGPGNALFKAMSSAIGALPVIAEDLGVIDKKVETLLTNTGFRGMRVLQFSHMKDDYHLPHNYTPLSVAYTGTHDNTTLLAWHHELDYETRLWALDYADFKGDWTVGGANCEINKSWIRALFRSGASLVIIPIQDLLGYGGDTRTNIPGTATGNWRFRIRADTLRQIDAGYYAFLNKTYFRNNPPM